LHEKLQEKDIFFENADEVLPWYCDVIRGTIAATDLLVGRNAQFCNCSWRLNC